MMSEISKEEFLRIFPRLTGIGIEVIKNRKKYHCIYFDPERRENTTALNGILIIGAKR